MASQEIRKIAVALEQLAARDSGSLRVTEAIVGTWDVVHAELRPIIGSSGVAALYWRSLCLVRENHPWLSAVQRADNSMDLLQLRAVLQQQNGYQAAVAGGAHLQALYELVASLIGASLTRQLLGRVWDRPFDAAVDK